MPQPGGGAGGNAFMPYPAAGGSNFPPYPPAHFGAGVPGYHPYMNPSATPASSGAGGGGGGGGGYPPYMNQGASQGGGYPPSSGYNNFYNVNIICLIPISYRLSYCICIYLIYSLPFLAKSAI